MTSRSSIAYMGRSLLLLLLGAVGCGQQGGVTDTFCEPACPNGAHCTESGCVADDDGRDFAVAAVDLAASCTPACSGAAPICRNGTCAACLTDADCPIGRFCKASGQTTQCVPGCVDDGRCGGGSMRCCNGGCTDTAKDPGNCGACATSCMVDRAVASCVDGRCTLGTCAAGWADCNANAGDGCEVNLRADASNCRACGMACALPNATVGCAGDCYIRACNYGWDDCNANEKDGCETNVLADVRNCGACRAACPNAARAKVGCTNASCQLLSCDPGFADCDGMVVNGCEIATGTDAGNCGACGMKCGQGLVCVQGGCTCPNCNLANAKSACVNLQCVVGSCNQGFGDCDILPQNGCERNLLTDASHCGVCGNRCAQGLVCTNGGCTCPQCNFPNASSKCINNVCVLDACVAGFGNCDNNPVNGCEIDFSMDAMNCGGCGKVCPMNLPYCMNSMCTVGCLKGKSAPLPCDSGIDRSGKKWVVCTADCNVAWISHADPGGGSFHPLDVCTTLGYSDWSGWDGTTNSVCGTNNGNTSCMMPGMPSFKRDKNAPNMNPDMWGPVIGNTVEWQCVK